MIHVFCLEHAHACLGGPWAPGASPWVPGGGCTWPKLQGSPPPTSTYRPFEFASKFMSILMSIFGRFGVDLGSLLGGHFRSCWRLFRPKLVPEPSSNRLIIEKAIVHETIRFPILFGPNGPQDGVKIDPRSPQDGSEIVLDRSFVRLAFLLDFEFNVAVLRVRKRRS